VNEGLPGAAEAAYSTDHPASMSGSGNVPVADLSQIPRKSRYQLREVCRYTDTQPYVLRFWESEFPQLNPGKGQGGQAIYTRNDIDLVLRIKQLLYEEEQTLDGARKILAREGSDKRGKAAGKPARARKAAASTRKQDAAPAASGDSAAAPARAGTRGPEALEFDSVPRERYEDAVEEISHLRFELKELESRARKAESQVARAEEEAETHKKRCLMAAERLEALLASLE